MDIDCIPFTKTGYFSKLICDYLDEKKTLHPFYNRFFHLKDFKGQLEEKATHFPLAHREVLYDALQRQYRDTKTSKKTKDHLRQLKEPITFTAVTGHQLNLFTGPLYFLYKIISTINLTQELKTAYPKFNFVPVYWMATEDHDFDEINYFNFKGKKLQWNKEVKGAVGRLATEGLQEVYDALANEIGPGKNAEALKSLFRKAYLEHDTLTEATRYLANELFGGYGLVILDGDDAALKRLLVPYAKRDLLENLAFSMVSETIAALDGLPEKYGIQVNPREINYFYLKDGLRERIIEKDDHFFVNETNLQFSKEALLTELETHPERFSPNVIARPLYQEVILPNLCYIGGGGEIAYWLELKAMFDAMQVPFPILLLRNSALLISKKQQKKLGKLNLSVEDLFLEQHAYINKKIREISNIDIDFSPQKQHLEKQFEALYELAEKTDPSFLGAVKAQEVKQKNGLDKLEKRLLKAQKRKLADHVERMTDLQNQLFPNQSLQERNQNFAEVYLELGTELIPTLVKSLKPLQTEFMILKYGK
ncbi:bacillithiol biosynthesis cysteine-adding enzyme BshC [Flavobacteriaceae bacterium TP-CH-4]|uniref:Putative cysteine ligase BshC n=1 Tax=Pelagihabitans pacificus TaxID=2696054 RepID=A0A967AWR9_9FLAO|nr:bacillithiol biosynthesis cysteine-adding enzyme BshC [Pelagihabitans pacificus]NHF61329.1 bacillithiol biosynthesis cysteine-adding enzyme BshC [Pelagihabitans pacificus]